MGPQGTAKQHDTRKTMMTGNIDLDYQKTALIEKERSSHADTAKETKNITTFL